jgi:hypothetical protein
MGMASQTSTQPEIISGPQSQHYSFYGNANKPARQEIILNATILPIPQFYHPFPARLYACLLDQALQMDILA